MTHASPFFPFWIIAKYKSSRVAYPNITTSNTASAFSLLDCFLFLLFQVPAAICHEKN